MMLINMGNAPVLMHSSLSFFLQYKVSCQKKEKEKKKRSGYCCKHLEFWYVFWFIFIWKSKQSSTILEIKRLQFQSSVIYARTDNKTIIY